jgi:hypothetical protein
MELEFAALAEALFSSGSVQGTLEQIVALADASIDGCDGAGVLTMAGERVEALAMSNDWVGKIDEIQIELLEGPCVDATMTGLTFYALDLEREDRWPRFAPAALAQGLRSVLAFALSADQLSALNLYARLPAAFGVTGRAQGQLFATLARLALDAARAREAEDLRGAQLNEAMRSRELIGQAQGILMERERITADQAFDVLRHASQNLNVKLRTVAERLVETGEVPDATRRRE